MNKNIHFWTLSMFITLLAGTINSMNRPWPGEDVVPATVELRSLREKLQEDWDQAQKEFSKKLQKQDADRKKSCNSIFLRLAALDDVQAFLKDNNITEIWWEDDSHFAKTRFWVDTPNGSMELDSADLREILKGAAVSYNSKCDFIHFDTKRYAIDSSEKTCKASTADLIEARRKSLESDLEKLRCSEFENQTNGN